MGQSAGVTADTNKAEILDVFLASSPTRSPRSLLSESIQGGEELPAAGEDHVWELNPQKSL